jgi:SAM-dependent methyltransferase
MYEADLASVYDLIYSGRGKDYRAECDLLTDVIRQRNAEARSLLDVACGTGGHLQPLKDSFAEVEGLELSRDMIAMAQRKIPGVVVHAGEVRDFQLERRYDSAICMFSSIGYMRDAGELARAIGRMAAHLNPGGVLVIEPWYFPDAFVPGYVAASHTEDDGHNVIRISHSVRQGTEVSMTVHYLYGTADGVGHFEDLHLMHLYTRAEYESAFRSGGCDVSYLTGIAGFPCGLFVGRRD